MSMITDPISDFLIRIKNANQRKNKDVAAPYSKAKETIAKILKEQGFITEFQVQGKGVEKEILVTLKYKGAQKAIAGVKRISKPGLKVYAKAESIPMVMSGYGTAIISTSKGMVTDKEARKQGVGGEVIAFI